MESSVKPIRLLTLLPAMLAVAAVAAEGETARALAFGALPAALAAATAWWIERNAPPSAGKECHAAILFMDVRGFTSLTSRMQPSEVFTVVNRLFEGMIPVIERHGGRVEKFLGDGLMASFGSVRDSDNPALNAVRCALKMQATCAWLNCTDVFRRAVGCTEPLRVEVGIGIAKGRVLRGSVGTGKVREVTALGRTVNLASRLCGLAGRGEVRCCNFSYLDVRSHASFSKGAEVLMKGLDQPIKTYLIEGLFARARTARHVNRAGVLPSLDQLDTNEFVTRVIKRLPEELRRTRLAIRKDASGRAA